MVAPNISADGPHPNSVDDRRSSPRKAIPRVLVALELVDAPDQPHLVASAIDLSAAGLSLIVDRELAAGTPVRVTFQLTPELTFARLPASIVREEMRIAVVSFDRWPEAELAKVCHYLAGTGDT